VNHADLVAVAAKWLKVQCRCPVVITEMVTAAMETPDAIGWTRGGVTTVVECKTSRSDFAADAKKFFRRSPNHGMGRFRYFMTEPGLLKPDELPAGWGLLEVTAKRVNIVKRSHGSECTCTRTAMMGSTTYSYAHCEQAFPVMDGCGEFAMLLSLIRRLAGPGVRGKASVFIDPYTNDEHGQPIAQSES